MMEFDESQFKAHHRTVVWLWFWSSLGLFVLGIVAIANIKQLSPFLPEGIVGVLVAFPLILPFVLGLLGLMLTLPFRRILLLIAKDQWQGFDDRGALRFVSIRPWGYPFFDHFDFASALSYRHSWVGRLYIPEEITRINVSLTHITIRGRIRSVKFDPQESHLSIPVYGTNRKGKQTITGWTTVIPPNAFEKSELHFSVVKKVRIPRNFTNEEKIIQINIPAYNQKSTGNTVLEKLPKRGVVRRHSRATTVAAALIIALAVILINWGTFYTAALDHAIETGNITAVKVIVALPGDIDNTGGRDAISPLSLASAHYSNAEIVEILIKAGANLHTKTGRFAATPLSFACFFDNPDRLKIVTLLLDAGANINASSFGGPPIARIYFDAEDPESVDRAYELFLFLLDRNADIGDAGIYGAHIHSVDTLNYYAFSGNLPILRHMIEEMQIDVNAANRYGSTPLHSAIEERHEDIVRYLLDAGADTAAKDLFGHTPLDLAESRGLTEIAAMLRQ